jgi:uncharacterized protein involved in type VI secretion and phage assembly
VSIEKLPHDLQLRDRRQQWRLRAAQVRGQRVQRRLFAGDRRRKLRDRAPALPPDLENHRFS